jgi:tRNA(Ile)-lysidine synthase
VSAALSHEQQVERFRLTLDKLIAPEHRLGLAVSGGPDSLALLLLASAARPGKVEAATVDHGLRPESRSEADFVADICEALGVPHTTLVIEWDEPPGSAVQEQARIVRYGALGRWMLDASLDALLTAHHLDDQAETLLMRLNRGAGVRGLAGMRAKAPLPDCPELSVVRPLLGWRREELKKICAAASLRPIVDPSNSDERFERVRIRRAIADADWLDPAALARSAANLAAADEALEWAVTQEWDRRVDQREDGILYEPSEAPAEIRRRVAAQAIGELATEGSAEELRGRELDRIMAELEVGGTATLRGVRCSGGTQWSFRPAASRRST